MEAAGLGIACVSLGETVIKLYKLTKKLRNAPESWERYRALLDSFSQLLEAVKGLTANTEGLDKVIVQRDGRNYGLIEFCMANTDIPLSDARMFVNKYNSIRKRHFPIFKKFFSWKAKILSFVIEEEQVTACIRNVETAMVGLSIAIHAASLARTNDAFNENRLAIGELTKQLSDTLAIIHKHHEESITRKERPTARFKVESKRRVLPRFPGKRDRQRQTIQVPEISSAVDTALLAGSELRAIQAPDVQTDVALVPFSHSEDHEGSMQKLLAGNLGVLATMASDPVVASGLPSIGGEDNNIEIVFEDGSAAFIPAPARTGFCDEANGDAVTSVRISQELSIIHPPFDKTVSTSDAQELLEFLGRHQTEAGAIGDNIDVPMTLVRLQSCFMFKFKMSDRSNEDYGSPETTKLRYLCVETLDPHLPDRKIDTLSAITAQKPCDQFPFCEHVKIDQLDGGKSTSELLQSTMGHIMFVVDAKGLETARRVPLFSQIDGSVYSHRCSETCDHTQIEERGRDIEGDTAMARCMEQIWLVAMIGRIGTTDDSDDDTESDRDAQLGPLHSLIAMIGRIWRTNGSDGSDGSDDSGDDTESDQDAAVGPFHSVPCLFCRGPALSPQMEETEELDSVVAYGKHSYGYTCARCHRVSWITGVEQAGFEQASETN